MSAVDIACICPGSPHEKDTVVLRQVMDFVHGKALRYRVQLLGDTERDDYALVLATLTEGYLLYGIESWTLIDEAGKPLPVTVETIRSALMSHPVETEIVSDKADDLYAEAVMLPLLQRARNSSPPTPTDESTSATNGSEPPRPLLLRQSSTSTTPTEGTVEISA